MFLEASLPLEGGFKSCAIVAVFDSCLTSRTASGLRAPFTASEAQLEFNAISDTAYSKATDTLDVDCIDVDKVSADRDFDLRTLLLNLIMALKIENKLHSQHFH